MSDHAVVGTNLSTHSVEREIARLRSLRRRRVGTAPGERVREEDVVRRIEVLRSQIRDGR